MFSAVDGRCLIVRQVTKSSPHSIYRGERPRSVAFEPGYNIGMGVENCSLTAIRTTFNTTSVPGDKTRSLPAVAVDTSTRNSRLKSEKGVLVTHSKIRQLSIALPCVDPVKVLHEQA